jgi:DNA (cytosine-5)-methyltransferase 1
VFRTNFPNANFVAGDLTQLLDGALRTKPTAREMRVQGATGPVDVLLGGPPCQGHSDLNNHTRRSDPKNALYLRMARAAEVLRPTMVVIENVPPVQWDSSDVVGTARVALEKAGYQVDGRVVDLANVGVPQTRKRFLLIASRSNELDPVLLIDELQAAAVERRTVRWAIGDLEDVSLDTTFDTATRMSEENARRVEYLFRHRMFDLPNSERPPCHRDNDHSYKSMYGRLRWDAPAQTITTGFGSMGQGRYVHPSRRRTLTPHEAARLQTFPDWFDFSTAQRRTQLATLIGNAVPPLLMVAFGRVLFEHGVDALSSGRSG